MIENIHKRLCENHYNLSVLMQIYNHFVQTQSQEALDALLAHLDDMDQHYSALKSSILNSVIEVSGADVNGDGSLDVSAIQTQNGNKL